MRRRLLCVIESSLEHTASCGDVVERVKSSCHWSGPRWHPLHQAVFHLIFLKSNTQENKLNRKRSKREKTEQSFSTKFLRNIFIFSEKKKEDDLKGRFGKKPQRYFQKRVSKKKRSGNNLIFVAKERMFEQNWQQKKKSSEKLKTIFLKKKKLVLFYILFSSVWSLLLLSLIFMYFYVVSEFSHFCFIFFFVFNGFFFFYLFLDSCSQSISDLSCISSLSCWTFFGV